MNFDDCSSERADDAALARVMTRNVRIKKKNVTDRNTIGACSDTPIIDLDRVFT